MIEQAIAILNANITGDWLTRKEGIVFPVKADDGKIYAFCLGTESCTRSNAVMPETSQKGILYWEDLNGTTLKSIEGDSMIFTNKMRLVGWMNLNKIGIDQETSPTTAREYKALVVRDLINQLSGYFTGSTGQARAKFNRELPKNPSIFSRYKWAEETGFAFYPYDYFAIDFEVDFTQSCSTPTVAAEVC